MANLIGLKCGCLREALKNGFARQARECAKFFDTRPADNNAPEIKQERFGFARQMMLSGSWRGGPYFVRDMAFELGKIVDEHADKFFGLRVVGCPV